MVTRRGIEAKRSLSNGAYLTWNQDAGHSRMTHVGVDVYLLVAHPADFTAELLRVTHAEQCCHIWPQVWQRGPAKRGQG